MIEQKYVRLDTASTYYNFFRNPHQTPELPTMIGMLDDGWTVKYMSFDYEKMTGWVLFERVQMVVTSGEPLSLDVDTISERLKRLGERWKKR